MNQANDSSIGPLLLTFLAGAAFGAVVVALTTPKSGPELREDFKSLARRTKGKTGDLAEDAGAAWDEIKLRAGHAASDLKRGVADSAADLKRGVVDSVDDLRGNPSEHLDLAFPEH
jgi:gas vesicle protein